MPVTNKEKNAVARLGIETSPRENKHNTERDSFYIRKIYPVLKRAIDIIASLIAIILLLPVFIATALAVVIESPGSAIHKRICYRNGKEFTIFKFRSMVSDADNLEKYFTPEQLEQYRKEIKLDVDPRITRVGKFIRKFSIDEIPQFVNVLLGSMSLVGPRPIIEEEVAYYGDDQKLLFSVKPGLTGYWQVNGRSNSTYESGERQKLELYYAKNRCLSLDIKILFMTAGAVIKCEGAR